MVSFASFGNTLGAMRGAQAREAEVAAKRAEVAEQELEATRKRAEDIQKQLDTGVKAISGLVKGRLESGQALDEGFMSGIKPYAERVISTARKAEELGYPISASIYEAQLRAAVSQPSPQQLAEVKAQGEATVTGATERAKLAPDIVDALAAAAGKTAAAKARGTASVPKPPTLPAGMTMGPEGEAQLVPGVAGAAKQLAEARASVPQARNATFNQQRAAKADAALAKARERYEQNPSIGNYATLAIAVNDARVGSGIEGVGEKQRPAIRTAAGALLQADSLIDKITGILQKNPAAATAGGAAASGLRNLTSNVQGLIETFTGLDIAVDPDLDLDQESYDGFLTEQAGNNQELKQAIYALALAEAASIGLNDSRMSNQDIEFAIKYVGGNIRDPKVLMRRLAGVKQKLEKSFKTRLDIAIGDYSTLDKAIPASGELTPEEQAELDALEQKYGK